MLPPSGALPSSPDSTMSANVYYVLHVLSIVLLTAYTFVAFADPDPRKRKASMMMTGIFTVLVLVGGFGLKARLGMQDWPGWLIVKIVIWLVLSGMAGMAFRRPALAGPLRLLTIVLVGGAIYLVYNKPF